MTGAQERPTLPDRLLSPDGTMGWYAYSPVGAPPSADDAEDDDTVEGPELRIMYDEGAGPLWSTGNGPLPDDPEWLKRALGLSDPLIADLLRWLRDMEIAQRRFQSPSELDERAERLAGRLQVEVGSRFRVRYHR